MVSEKETVLLQPPSNFGALALEYLAECERNKTKPNVLLFKRLDLASVGYERGEGLDLVCIGSEKETFLQRLKDSDLEILLQSLKNKNAKLRSLDFSFHCLSDETGRLFSLFNSVIEPIEALRLKSNLLTESGADDLCLSLSKCPSLSLLDLSNNKLGRRGGKAVAALLGKLKHLKALDVSNCEIDLEGLVFLTTAIQDDNRSLDVLNLANPAVSFNSEHYYHIAGVLKLAHLMELELANQSLRDDGVETLAPFLLKNKTLKSLGLACNQITWRGAAALGRVLSASTPLEFLDLCCNRLADYGAECLSAGLGSNSTLKVLLLSRNSINPKALLKLADALSLNCSLEALAVLHNNFDAASLRAFAEMEKHFLRVEPLTLDFVVYYVDGDPHAAPNTENHLLQRRAAALPPFTK